MIESSAGILMRVWEETFLLFIDYLRKSPSSPFKRFNAIFVRKEYQTSKGNLSHAHLMICLLWEAMTEKEREFVNDLIRASIFDIVRPDEVDRFMKEGVFTYRHDIFKVWENTGKFLPHICNDGCLVKNADGTFRCRKIDNLKASPDNTKHMFLDLPNDYSVACLRILEAIGMTKELEIDDDGNVLKFVSTLPFFHPKRYVPPTNPTDDRNISPVEGYIFAITKSMQNVQKLTGAGGCSKYVCKYIAKIDEQNYVIICVDGEGCLVSKATFLHNIKVSSSKAAEDSERKKHSNKPQGRCISQMEMMHVMLKYPEVVTNLEFIKLSTMPLELRGGIALSSDVVTEDSAYICLAIESFRRTTMEFGIARLQTQSQNLIVDDLKLSKISVDKVTQFGLRPLELRRIIPKLGDYYCWFIVDSKKVKVDDFSTKITADLFESCWVDCLQRQVRVRKKALPHVMLWCESLEESLDIDDDECDHILEMIDLFKTINAVVHEDLEVEDDLRELIFEELIYDDDEKEHLPIPVYSYIAPTMTTSFIIHFLLSEGEFETEIDILLHNSLRESFRYCKLIGPNDDEESLKHYANQLTKRYIEEQVQYFPNTQRVIDFWIITAHKLFYRIIVDDELPISDIPSVQLSSFVSDQIEEILEMAKTTKENLIDAAFREIGLNALMMCNVPTKRELMDATLENPIDWDPVASLRKSPYQSDESFEEQKLAIKTCVDAVDTFANIMSNQTYTKNVGIRGIPVGGKTFCGMFCLIYTIAKGLKCTSTAMMCKRALQLGGTHAHKIWSLPTDDNMTPHRRAELTILKLLREQKKIDFLCAVNVLFFDEMGQCSAEYLSTFDIIMRRVRNSNIFCGGILILFSIDHFQIQPISGRPFFDFLSYCSMLQNGFAEAFSSSCK